MPLALFAQRAAPAVMFGGTGKKASSSGAVRGERGYQNAKQPVFDELDFGKQAAQTVSRMHEQVDRHTCAQPTHLQSTKRAFVL